MLNTGYSYWFASRSAISGTDQFFGIHFQNTKGGIDAVPLCKVYKNGLLNEPMDNGGFMEKYFHEHGLRPCISLKTDAIKIIWGNGTEGNPYVLEIRGR